MSPEITAIIPTHNRTRLLATTLRTVLWQRAVDLEVIVVDDGSSEDTAAVVDEAGDARVRLIRNEQPRGVCAARNRGAAEAGGTWLAFCDDDDLWAPDKLARQLAAARAADRVWAYGGAVHVNTALRILSAKPAPSFERLVGIVKQWNLMPGGSSNVIVRADALAMAGAWDTGLINLADWDLWMRLARQGLPASVNSPLVGYRIHPGNASGDTELILREACQLDGRYGARVDYGQLYHYLAWVHLRAGRRRQAVPHLVRALARGQLRPVTRSVAGLLRRQLSKRVRMLEPAPEALHRAWMDEAEAWVAPLREVRADAA